MTRVPELEARLDVLTTQILLPLRASKEVDSQAINKLYRLVADLALEIGESTDISRRLAGKALVCLHPDAERGGSYKAAGRHPHERVKLCGSA